MLFPPWLATGNHIFEVDGARSGDMENDKVWALQKHTKDWSSYNLTIYADCSVKDCTEAGGRDILATIGHQFDPTNHQSHAIPAVTWCLLLQSKM